MNVQNGDVVAVVIGPGDSCRCDHAALSMKLSKAP